MPELLLPRTWGALSGVGGTSVEGCGEAGHGVRRDADEFTSGQPGRQDGGRQGAGHLVADSVLTDVPGELERAQHHAAIGKVVGKGDTGCRPVTSRSAVTRIAAGQDHFTQNRNAWGARGSNPEPTD